MTNGWTQLKLGDILRKSEDWLAIAPEQKYREVTVRLWGKGVTLRRDVLGTEIKAEKRLRVRTNQFIVSRIDARNGAFGLIPPELDGAVVSNDFPVFTPHTERLYIPYLGWLSRTRGFIDMCIAASEGTTNRVRLKEDRFLSTTIRLPPLPEQRRIVARIDQLAAKIDEARRLRRNLQDEFEILQRSAARQVFRADSPWPRVALETVCTSIIDCLHSNPVYSEKGTYPTIRSPDVGWGTIDLANARRTDEAEYLRRTRRGELQSGDLILVREGGGTGKAAIVENRCKFSLGQRVMMLRPNSKLVAPRFLLHQWLSPFIFQEQIMERMKGSASPHLNIKAVRKFDFLLPSLPEQRHVVAYLDTLSAKADALKQLQAVTAAELDALLPSILDKAFKGEL